MASLWPSTQVGASSFCLITTSLPVFPPSQTRTRERCTMLRLRLRIPSTTRSFSQRTSSLRLPHQAPPRTCHTSAHPSHCGGRKLGSSCRTFLKAEITRPTVLPAIAVGAQRKFHSTPRVGYSPILALLVGVLKVCFFSIFENAPPLHFICIRLPLHFR